MSDPVFVNGASYVYFTCDRDPTPTEADVDAIGLPADWLVYWWNQTTKTVFILQNTTNGSYIWQQAITDANLSAALSALGISASTASWHNMGSPVSGSRAIVTVNNVANAFELSSSGIASARYNITLTTNPGLLSAASASVSAYVASTNSTNPTDWILYDEVSFSIPSGIALSGVTSIQTLVLDDIPAGYFIRLLGATSNGTTVLNSFREKY